jgi:hypothetical protein
MGLRRALALVALAAMLVAGGALGAGERSAPLKCKTGQIKVKVGRKTACRAFRVAFPRPRKVDPRLAFVKGALDFTAPRAAAHSGKRPFKSLKGGFGSSGRKAYKAILHAVPKALARVDRLAPSRAPRAAPRSAVAVAAADCSGPTPSSDRGFTDGGVTVSTSFGDGGMGMTISFSTHGYSFRVRYFTSVGCDSLDPPACPTASGAADAKSSRRDRVLIEIRKDGQLVSSQSSTVRRETKTHGQVAADAKLDFVVVDDSVHMSTTVNGHSIDGSIVRHTRIDMRTERYEPSESTATFAGAESLQKTESGGFAALAGAIIAIYRSAESNPGRLGFGAGWAVFDRPDGGNYCIRAKYSPDISTIKPKKNTTGTFTGQAIASDGGVAADGRWPASEQSNGTFSPAVARGGSATVTYRVTDGGPGKRLSVTFRITSTAGVVKSTWSQDTEDDTTINHIEGSFSGSITGHGSTGDSVLSVVNGSAAYDRFSPAVYGGADGQYRLRAGSYTLVASGLDGSGITGCQQTGSKTFTLAGGTIGVTGTPPNFVAPYSYTFDLLPPFETMTVTRVNCPPAASMFEGTQFQAGQYAAFSTNGAHTSSDGLTYQGSEDQTFGGAGPAFSWSFHGTQ